MINNCGFYWLEEGVLAGSAYPGPCLSWLYNKQGIRAIISLETLKPPDYETATQLGFQIVTIPIPDYTAGTPELRKQALKVIEEFLSAGVPTLVHCKEGLGRTGMVLALYLVQYKGLSSSSAIRKVRSIRAGSIEVNTGQVEAIHAANNKS